MALDDSPDGFVDKILDLFRFNLNVLQPFPGQEDLGFETVEVFVELLEEIIGGFGVV